MDRYAHHRNEEFARVCRQITKLGEVADRSTSIDTYSREKLGQVKELAERGLQLIDQTTQSGER